MKKIIKFITLVLIIFCFQCCSVFAQTADDYFKGKVKTIHSKYDLKNSIMIKLQDDRLFFYDGLDVILFDSKTYTFRKSLTTPTLDGKPTKYKHAILLPNGNVLISRPQSFPTLELEKEILKTLKLSQVRNFNKEIFPYIKAYPKLYKEYLRQKEIYELSSYCFIYNPKTEKIILTKNKGGVYFSATLITARNKKIYGFFRGSGRFQDVYDNADNLPVFVYNPETNEIDIIYVNIKGHGKRYATLNNVIPLNNDYIMLLYGDEAIYWDDWKYMIYYLYDTKTNKVIGPRYFNSEKFTFSLVNNDTILIKPDGCSYSDFVESYKYWSNIPQELLIYTEKDDRLSDKDVLLGHKLAYAVCPTDIRHNFLYSRKLNDGRLFKPYNKKIKILTPNKY